MAYGLGLVYIWLVVLGVVGGVLGVWVALELGTVIVVVWGGLMNSRVSGLMEYFFVQALSSLALIGGAISGITPLLYGGILLKFGLFPCMSWVYRVVLGYGDLLGFGFILGGQKIVPFQFVWGCLGGSSSGIFIGVCGISVVFGLMAMAYSNSVSGLIVGSSFMHTAWILLMVLWGCGYWLHYFVGYLLLVVGIGVTSHLGLCSVYASAVLMLAAAPPMMGFILKLVSVLGVEWERWVMVLLILLGGCVSICFYAKPLMSSLMGQVSSIWGCGGYCMGVALCMSLLFMWGCILVV